MTLVNVPLQCSARPLTVEVQTILREAIARERQFANNRPLGFRGFVPSCHETVFRALQIIEQDALAPGTSFCEWGSGLGVATLLAGVLGFDACGIEIDRELLDAAREMAGEFKIGVEFVHGSYVPSGADLLIDKAYARCDGELSLVTEADDAYETLGMDIRDFDLVFNYPWPNDEYLTAALFDKFASEGALLLTYVGLENVRLRRKESSPHPTRRRHR